MRKIKIALGLALLFLAIALGWAVSTAEVAQVNLHEDIRDIAAQGGTQNRPAGAQFGRKHPQYSGPQSAKTGHRIET